MKTIVHVAQDAIRANVKDGGNRPAIIVRNYKGATRHHEVDLGGGVKIVQRMHKPLSCGARIYIETENDVRPL